MLVKLSPDYKALIALPYLQSIEITSTILGLSNTSEIVFIDLLISGFLFVCKFKTFLQK